MAHCIPFAAVSRISKQTETRVGLRAPADDIRSSICRAIIDNDDLEVFEMSRLKETHQFAEGIGKPPLFVERRNNNGKGSQV